MCLLRIQKIDLQIKVAFQFHFLEDERNTGHIFPSVVRSASHGRCRGSGDAYSVGCLFMVRKMTRAAGHAVNGLACLWRVRKRLCPGVVDREEAQHPALRGLPASWDNDVMISG